MKNQELIENMSLAEKASLLSGGAVFETREIERLGIPSISLNDGPNGVRKQVGASDHLGLNESYKATCFPTAVSIASSWSVELGEKIGVALGEEAKAFGVNVLLAPGLNVKRSPLCGRNFEYFSEDPYFSGKMASGYVKGIQSVGISACPKHFAVNSQEYLRMMNDSILDERTLHEIYLTGFEIVVKDAKPKFLMSSYNRINGEYANENKYLLDDILRKEWGFDGAVVSDWGGSNDHTKAVEAGSHLEMPSAGLESVRELIKAVENGKLDESVLNQRVDEYLSKIFEISKNESEEHSFDIDEHNELARVACENSAILLKNIDKILPISKTEKVAVVGDFAKTPRYQGAGSSVVNPTKLTSFIDAIKNSDYNYIGFEQGFERNGKANKELLGKAVEISKKADKIVIFLGLDEIIESEGFDRRHLKLRNNQIELIDIISKINPNIIVVLCCGSVVEMDFENNCKAILHANLCGQAGGDGILNLLYGIVNPSGKLTETYPLKLADTPCAKWFPGIEKTAEYRESIFVGYRYYDTKQVKVRFPFGFGLSYTNFEYSNIKIDNDVVTFSIKNTGDVDGSEVSQLYVEKCESKIFRAKKELKGFAKTFIKAGESIEVSITLDETSFRYFNVKTNKFEIERGEYRVLVGSSSVDIRLCDSVMKEGTTAVLPYEGKKLDGYFNVSVHEITDEEFSELLGKTIPTSKWDIKKPLDRNDCLSQMGYARSRLARLVYRIMISIKKKSDKKGKPNLNIVFLLHMPFRGIAKNSNGMMTLEMTDAILEIVNGKFFRGVGHLIKSKFKQKKLDTSTQQLIDEWKNQEK